MLRTIPESVIPAISMSSRSSSILKRSFSALLSASMPAPPECMSVPSISKRRRRFRLFVMSSEVETSLAISVLGKSEISRDSSTAPGMTKRSGRVHDYHGDHASEKCQRGKRGDSENRELDRVASCRSFSKWRSIGETGGRCARLGRFRLDGFQFRQRLRTPHIGFETRFNRAKLDPVFETQNRVGNWDAVHFCAVGRFEIFQAINFADQFQLSVPIRN